MDENEKRIRRRLRDDFPHYASKCLLIRTKVGEINPLILNKCQRIIHEKVEDQRRRCGKIRAIILKGRQQGCSTYIEGRLYWRVTHRFGVRAFILTHDIEATNNLFEMANRYHDHCPLVVRPNIKASNAKELIFEGLESGYKLGTAGNKAVGRSSTIQYLHGCLAEGTKIYQSLDIKNIEDLNVGDYVLTHKLNLAKISFISSQKKECISIKFRTLTKFPLVATKEHQFLTKNGWKKLGEMKIGDEIGFPIFDIHSTINWFDLPKAPIRRQKGGRQFICPDKIKVNYKLGRLIGLYLADGHIKKQTNEPFNCSSIHFTVHRKEVSRTIEWLLPFKKYYSSMNVKHRKNCLTSVVTIYGNRFSCLINEICGRTKEKHIPNLWKEMSKDFCKGILHGYFSGDGSSYKETRRISAPSICSKITIPLRDIVASLGYGWGSIGYIKEGLRNGRNEKARYIFSLCGDGASKLAKEIGKETPNIIRKKTKSIKKYAANTTEISNGYAWLRIVDIENVGIKKVYDFEIDHDDHSYCTIHGASHNSEVAYWPNAAEHAKGILQAVPDSPDTEIYLESTACGTGNYFHQQWQLAEAGLSDFIPIFIPWYWQDEYKRVVPKDFKRNEEEDHLSAIYGLNNEQLEWRRYKINSLSVGGSDGTKAFMQEYPCSAREAFVVSGDKNFIEAVLVEKARKCKVEGVGRLIIGIDSATTGNDRTAIIRRRGRKSYNLQTYIKRSPTELANIIHRIIEDEKPDLVVLDGSPAGGGAEIRDRLYDMKIEYKEIVKTVLGGNIPYDKERYFNKRAEMWAKLKEFLADYPAEIPDSDELEADLCNVQLLANDHLDRIKLERKEEMKKRGIRSPDCGDALANTFAFHDTSYMVKNSKENKEIAKNVMSGFNNIDRLKKAAYKK